MGGYVGKCFGVVDDGFAIWCCNPPQIVTKTLMLCDGKGFGVIDDGFDFTKVADNTRILH